MKTSIATALGVSGLTAAVIGFGVAVPSLAEDASTTSTTTEDSASTSDPAAEGTTEDEDDVRDPHGGGADGPRGHGPRGLPLTTAADTLGLTAEELGTQLAEGTTLGEIADAEGVDRQALVDALLAAAESDIQELLDQPLTGGPGPRGMGGVPGGAVDGLPPESDTAVPGGVPGEDGSTAKPWQPESSTDGAGAGDDSTDESGATSDT